MEPFYVVVRAITSSIFLAAMATGAEALHADRQSCLEIFKNKFKNFDMRILPASNFSLDQQVAALRLRAPIVTSSTVSAGKIQFGWSLPRGGNSPFGMTWSAEATLDQTSHFVEARIENGRAKDRLYTVTVKERFQHPPLDTTVTQVRDVDLNCLETVVSTAVESTEKQANSLIEKAQMFGAEGEVAGQLRTKFVLLPVGQQPMSEFPALRQGESWSAYFERLRFMPFVFAGPIDAPLQPLRMEPLPQSERFDPLVGARAIFYGYKYTMMYEHTPFEFQRLQSVSSTFQVSLSRDAEDWILPFEFWNKGSITEPNGLLHGTKLVTYYEPTRKPKKIALTSSLALDFENFASYWKIDNTEHTGLWERRYTLEPRAEVDYNTMTRRTNKAVKPAEDWLRETDIVKFNFPQLQSWVAETKLKLDGEPNSFAKVIAITRTLASHFSYDYKRLLVGQGIEEMPTDRLLTLNGGTCGNFSNVFTAMARAMGIPTRMIYGYYFSSGTLEPHMWAEFQDEAGVWRPFEPQNYTGKFDPANYFPLTLLKSDSYKIYDLEVYWHAGTQLMPVVIETTAAK